MCPWAPQPLLLALPDPPVNTPGVVREGKLFVKLREDIQRVQRGKEGFKDFYNIL
jgi:hypothetical protein